MPCGLLRRTLSSIGRAAAVYALLFGAVGAWVPYIALYLGSRGLDVGGVGALLALHATVSLLAAPTWGALADGVGDARGPILVAGLVCAAATALLGLSASPLVLSVAIAIVASTFAGIIPMVDSRVVRIIGGRERFGQARAWGSAAFIVVAFATGAAVGRFGPVGLFVLNVPLLAAAGVGAWVLLRMSGPEPASPIQRRRMTVDHAVGQAFAGLSPSRIGGVLRIPRMGLFVLASTVIWTAQASLNGFIALRVAGLGGDATMIAAVFSLGALVEVPLMLSFPRLARRLGAERLIVIGAFAYALRALASALATSPEQIVAASIFGGFGFAFVYVGTVTWVSGAVPRTVQATAQGIATGTTVSVGAIVGSLVGGAIGAALGLSVLFGIAAASYGLGGLLVWAAIVRRGPSAPSAPAAPQAGITVDSPGASERTSTAGASRFAQASNRAAGSRRRAPSSRSSFAG